MRFLRRFLVFCICITVLPLAASLGYARLWVEPEPQRLGAAIIVLSGPGAEQSGIEGETLERVERGIALFEAGMAPRLIMTGGAPFGRSAAELMRDYALEQGVPPDRVSVETASRSTLQNAEFVARMGPGLKQAPVLIVTHRYHLLRSLASFRWGGFTDIRPAAPDSPSVPLHRSALMEAIKWPVNVVRGGVGRVAFALGAAPETVDPFLQ